MLLMIVKSLLNFPRIFIFVSLDKCCADFGQYCFDTALFVPICLFAVFIGLHSVSAASVFIHAKPVYLAGATYADTG